MDASNASASCSFKKVLKALNPRILLRRLGTEIGRENMQKQKTRMPGNRDAHDSRTQVSAKLKGLEEDGQRADISSQIFAS